MEKVLVNSETYAMMQAHGTPQDLLDKVFQVYKAPENNMELFLPKYPDPPPFMAEQLAKIDAVVIALYRQLPREFHHLYETDMYQQEDGKYNIRLVPRGTATQKPVYPYNG